MDASIFLVVAALLVVLYVWKMWKFHYASFKIKGPTPLPLLGNCLEFVGMNQDIYSTMTRLVQTYGNCFKVWIGPKFNVVLSNPEDLKITMNNSNSMQKTTIYQLIDTIAGDSIFSQKNVSRWRLHRKLLETTFSINILNSFIHIFEKNALILCEDFEKMVGKGTFDVFPFVDLRSINTIVETTMGTKQNLPSLDSNLRIWFHDVTVLFFKRIFSIWLYPDFIYKLTKEGKRFSECVKNIRGYNETIIQEKKRLYKENKQVQFKDRVLLNYLLEISQETGQYTEKEIRDEVATFVFAGSHSTALTISYTLMLLGMHPEIQNKVYNELQEVFNDDDEWKITKEDLNKMNYLQRVIKESLRLFPFAPLIGRNATKDIQLSNCLIPKGTECIFAIFYTHRDPKLWPDPLKFDPDRFLPEEIQKRHPYSWIPFSGGPRNCIGLRYAMMSIKVFLSYIIRKYKIYCDCKSIDDIKLQFEVSLTVADGWQISLEPRQRNI